MALLLAVHAHPDDESLWTGALLATWAREGEVELVTCTRGERGEVIGAELAHLEGDGPALAAHREGELERATAELGVHHHAFLDELRRSDGASELLEDSGMAWLEEGVAGPAAQVPERAFVRAEVEDVAASLAAHLERRRPAVVVTYGPDGGYGHPDHVRAHEVTMRAVELLGRSGARVPAVLWVVAPGRAEVVGAGPGPSVAVPLAPVVDVVAAAMRAHATQVQDVVVDADTIGFALSNDVPLRVGPVETYELAPGSPWPVTLTEDLEVVDRRVP